MRITITKAHVEGAEYRDIYGCPLVRALKEKNISVIAGGYCVTTEDNECHYFDCEEWGAEKMKMIQNGEIESVTLDIPTLHFPYKSKLFKMERLTGLPIKAFL